MADALALMQWEERGIVKSQQKLADFVQYFQSTMELNNDGMPLRLIDPTVIAECVPYAETTDDVPEEKYNQAIRQIDFEDNVPCIDGLPIWERLDGENIPYYKIFKEYRDMKYLNNTQHNTRSIARLAEIINAPGRLIAVLAKIYHWIPRVKAYDQQREIEIMLAKHKNIEALESKHAKYSNAILEQAITFLEKNPNKIDPKTALQMVELGMKYGRISAGLLGDKPGTQAYMNSGGAHQTNIAISQTNTHNEAGQMLNVTSVGGVNQGGGGHGGSAVERRLNSNMKDQSQLMSVLHVLNQSGAFKAVAQPAIGEENLEDEEARYDMYDDGVAMEDIIDVTYEDETDDDTLNINDITAVPGTKAQGGY